MALEIFYTSNPKLFINLLFRNVAFSTSKFLDYEGNTLANLLQKTRRILIIALTPFFLLEEREKQRKLQDRLKRFQMSVSLLLTKNQLKEPLIIIKIVPPELLASKNNYYISLRLGEPLTRHLLLTPAGASKCIVLGMWTS